MGPMTFERAVVAPVDLVWAVMTDVARYPERFAAVDATVPLTGDTFGVDTRWRETRTVYGRPATLEIRVTEAEPPRRYVTEAQVGARAVTEFDFTPSMDGTHTSVRVTFRTEGGGLAYRIAEFLNSRRIRTCVTDNNEQDLADLARACEGEQHQRPTPT
jgi:uncharacterized protein YndB with AHSA1/START domain